MEEEMRDIEITREIDALVKKGFTDKEILDHLYFIASGKDREENPNK